MGAQLLSAAITQPDHVGTSAVRYIKWIKHGPLEIEPSTWVLLRAASTRNCGSTTSSIGRVQAMMGMVVNGCLKYRIWCNGMAVAVSESADGLIRVQKSACLNTYWLIRMEEVSITTLSYQDRGDHYECRYVW